MSQSHRLRHVSDAIPGIQRRRVGKVFCYVLPSGRKLRAPAALKRIKTLAIPPAWTDVWICPNENGHIQAIGRDARGRKQYRYHPRYRSFRDEAKFSRLIEFASKLPQLRKQVDVDLRSHGLGSQRVLAIVTRLLDVTCIRVGNTEYTRQNGSFGLTTLQDKHVRVLGNGVRLSFNGKSGIEHKIDVNDPKLAALVKRCRDLPGYELFQYADEAGKLCKVDSTMVNEYIRSAMHADFTAKDFRTWRGTIEAMIALQGASVPNTKKGLKSTIAHAVNIVAERLGNRPATCRKFYIHPEVFVAFGERRLPEPAVDSARPVPRRGLSREEKCVLQFLRSRV